MLITGHFFSEAPLLSLTYFANYMNIQKEKKNDESAGHSSKGIPVLSEYAKSLERRVKEIYPEVLLLKLSGDVHPQHGPAISQVKTKYKAPRCPQCEKPVQQNHKRLQCCKCFELTHRRCASSHYANFSSAAMPIEWTCPNCTLSELPFFHSNELVDMPSIYENTSVFDSTLDPHRDAIAMRPKQVSFIHLNTQSMTSTFDELLITVQDYGFDIITLSETWLKDNKHLLDHVSIPGYVNGQHQRRRCWRLYQRLHKV